MIAYDDDTSKYSLGLSRFSLDLKGLPGHMLKAGLLVCLLCYGIFEEMGLSFRVRLQERLSLNGIMEPSPSPLS